MRRNTFIFGWVLLPVWLAAAANISFDASFDSVAQNGTTAGFSVSTEHGRHKSSKDIPPIKHALRHPVRRALIPGETDDRSIELTGTITAAAVAWRPEAALMSAARTPEDILQSWNFRLRNALEPRAPSATSAVS